MYLKRNMFPWITIVFCVLTSKYNIVLPNYKIAPYKIHKLEILCFYQLSTLEVEEVKDLLF